MTLLIKLRGLTVVLINSKQTNLIKLKLRIFTYQFVFEKKKIKPFYWKPIHFSARQWGGQMSLPDGATETWDQH